MTPLTERYLDAALRGIPQRQRGDVERELRSSIDDAVEDRVGSGEDRGAAEKAVLEGLGNPALLAARYTGRPMYLIGPDLFLAYRHVLLTVLAVAAPVAGAVRAAVELASGAGYWEALIGGIGGAVTVAMYVAVGITLTFALLERVEAVREARTEIASATSRWTVDQLPHAQASRVSIGETIGEVLTLVLSIGGLLFLRDLAWARDGGGQAAQFFNPELPAFWLPALVGVLAALLLLQVAVLVVGRWTLGLASGHAVLQLAFSVPVVVLAASGSLVNPGFSEAIGWSALDDGDGPVMLSVAAGVLLVTAWDIWDAFRRARRDRRQGERNVVDGRPA